MFFSNITFVLTLVGTAAFATTGALLAAKKHMDIVGYIFLAAIVGIGGGTFRDLFLDLPLFWIQSPIYLYLCVGCGIFTYAFIHSLHNLDSKLVWFDAVGLSVFSVLSTSKALSLNMPYSVALIMGVTSACLGGIIRDVICNVVPIFLRREIYITAALLGAIVTVTTDRLTGVSGLAIILGFLSAFSMRGLAIVYKFHLPVRKMTAN